MPLQTTGSVRGMRSIPGGAFRMGSDNFYPEEAPTRMVDVNSFFMDETLVTNADFAKFVAATGYVTDAEQTPTVQNYPGLLSEAAAAGSSVFIRQEQVVCQGVSWWKYVVGACWHRPLGPDSTICSALDHPVVHVTYRDANAYAAWAGKSLPNEAEWEFAARGGIEGAEFAWGEELAPDGQMMANYWQGDFPMTNLLLDGWERTSPVRSFPENGYGLFDMIGNVWEWTSEWWSYPSHAPTASCCGKAKSAVSLEQSADPDDPFRIPRRVIKGGSHLCAPNYCQRYRPAARHPHAIDTSTSHVGFRCVVRPASGNGELNE